MKRNKDTTDVNMFIKKNRKPMNLYKKEVKPVLCTSNFELPVTLPSKRIFYKKMLMLIENGYNNHVNKISEKRCLKSLSLVNHCLRTLERATATKYMYI